MPTTAGMAYKEVKSAKVSPSGPKAIMDSHSSDSSDSVVICKLVHIALRYYNLKSGFLVSPPPKQLPKASTTSMQYRHGECFIFALEFILTVCTSRKEMPRQL